MVVTRLLAVLNGDEPVALEVGVGEPLGYHGVVVVVSQPDHLRRVFRASLQHARQRSVRSNAAVPSVWS
jgi:hypothetical protein